MEATMTVDIVTLYGLSLHVGQNINVGPYAWKTAVDLGALGVPYRLEGRTFEEIRTTFEKDTVPGITVPAIQDGERWVLDSFKLAQYVSVLCPLLTRQGWRLTAARGEVRRGQAHPLSRGGGVCALPQHLGRQGSGQRDRAPLRPVGECRCRLAA